MPLVDKPEVVEKWEQMARLVDGWRDKILRNELFFRGHSSSDWKLETTLERSIPKGSLKVGKKTLTAWREFVENIGTKIFLRDASIYIENIHSLSAQERWFHMRHYGCPVRILDWSMSPYVALYFALSDFVDQNASVLCAEQRLVASSVIEPGGKVYFVDPKTRDLRMQSQQGVFSFTEDISDSHEMFVNYKKYIIPKEKRKEFMKHLSVMNITAKTLFPGMDGLGKSVQEAVHLDQW